MEIETCRIPTTSKVKCTSSKTVIWMKKKISAVRAFGNLDLIKILFPTWVKKRRAAGPFDGQDWSKLLLLICAVSVLVDPLYLYVPVMVGDHSCLDREAKIEIWAAVIRSIMDALFVGLMVFQILSHSWSLTNRRLTSDARSMSSKLPSSSTVISVLALLPLPQVATLIIIPIMDGPRVLNTKNMLKFVVLIQLAPRFLLVYSLYKRIGRTSIMTSRESTTAVAINLFLYFYVAHVLGSFWYLFSLETQFNCWLDACGSQIGCVKDALFCETGKRHTAFQSCVTTSADGTAAGFGLFADAIGSGIVKSKNIILKILYCFWWAIKNLSSLGQNLQPSHHPWEICFAITIFVCGLALWTLVIGILQTRLLSSTISTEEKKNKWRSVEQWMTKYRLPEDVKNLIREHENNKLLETRGLDVTDFLCSLPRDIARTTKRHLGLTFLSNAPIFGKLEPPVLDAICDRLKPVLYTANCYIVREGSLVDEMVFVTQGSLTSETMIFGSDFAEMTAGAFCGEEILNWSLDPLSTVLPIATRTVKTDTKVEGFSLQPEDLKFVFTQFRVRDVKRFATQNFLYYSQPWRVKAARSIQAVWRRRWPHASRNSALSGISTTEAIAIGINV